MIPSPELRRAIEVLCARFEHAGYNPTPVIDLGALVANADGSVDAAEREALLEIVQSMLEEKMTDEVIGHLIAASLDVIRASGVEARVRLLAEILLDCDAVEEGLTVALSVAYASEGLSAAERGVVESLARQCELPAARLEELIETARRNAARG